MNCHEFLIYSANEPMKILRKKYNQGEDVYKAVPRYVSQAEALVDISYVRYVMEQAYSGYTYFEKSQFDNAFVTMEDVVKRRSAPVPVNDLIDLIADHLSFICDGHLAFTTKDYGKGFYRKTQTYVADLLIEEIDGRYVDAVSGETVLFGEGIRLFPTVSASRYSAFLVGVRSKEAITEIELTIGKERRTVPVHKIKSKAPAGESLIQENYDGDIAYITCSTFVGDAEDDLRKCYEIGEKCRGYRHVIWDLSNNLGGNSEFPKQFLTGLNGGCADMGKVLDLQSTLVYAKEHGEVREVPYCLKSDPAVKATGGGLFTGTLHVIINDGVASSGESAIVMAAAMENAVFYGCNFLGIGKFGDLCIYYLPNSKVTLWCPQKVFDHSIEESAGYEPDIWIDSSDVISCVTKHIKVN